MLNAIEIVRYIDCGHITADTITSDQLSDLCQYVADIQTDAKLLIEFLSALESPLDEFEEFVEVFDRWFDGSTSAEQLELDKHYDRLKVSFLEIASAYDDLSWELEDLAGV